MIGNDVVDIQLARLESNPERKGYMDKIFTPAEQDCILQYYDKEIMLWVLWSMKEAAYKAYNRQTGHRAYIPLKLECHITSIGYDIKGYVCCNDTVFITRTTVEDEIITTIAVLNLPFNKIKVFNNVNVIKDNFGLPYISTITDNIVASVSHHGRAEQIIGLIN